MTNSTDLHRQEHDEVVKIENSWYIGLWYIGLLVYSLCVNIGRASAQIRIDLILLNHFHPVGLLKSTVKSR